MKNFVLTLCCIFLFIASSYKSHAGVICEEGSYPVMVNAVTCCEETITDFMVFTFWDGDDMVISQTINFTGAPAGYVHEFCVPAGCYTVQCDYSQMNASHFQSITFNSEYFYDLHVEETWEGLPWNFEVCVGEEDNDCPTEIWSGAGNDCGVMNFEIGSFVQGEEVVWYPGDESGAVEGGHFFSHHYEEPGTYNVCAFYTTPACPQGVELCTEIVVESCSTLCPESISVEYIEGYCYEIGFQVGEVSNDNASVDWFFEGDDPVYDFGDFIWWGFSPDESGFNSVCAFYTSPTCPNGVELCTTFFVCDGETACPDSISSGVGNDCGAMNFEIGSFVQGEEVVWYPGDESGAVEGGHFFSHHYEEPGTYNVCAFYTTPACPDGVELCTEIVVEDCESTCTEFSIGLDSQINDGGPEVAYWVILNANNESIDNGMAQYSANDPYYDHVFCLEDGCYTLIVEGLGVAEELFDIFIQVYGESIIQNIDVHNENLVYVTFGINSDCVVEEECEASFEVLETFIPGNFQFINTSNITEDVQWVWSFGNGSTSTDVNSATTYAENGTYEVCLTMYIGDCVSQYCEEVLVNEFEQECTPIELTIHSDVLDGGTAALAYTLWSTIQEETTAFDNITFSPQITSFTFSGCIPDDCYQLTIDNDQPIVLGQNIDIVIEIDGEPLGSNFDLIAFDEVSFTIQFGVNSTCTIGVNDQTTNTLLNAYPNPANNTLYITRGKNEVIHLIEVIDIAGNLVMSFNPNAAIATLDVSSLSSGFYFVKTKSGYTNSIVRIAVQH